jgi:hypothetical protein
VGRSLELLRDLVRAIRCSACNGAEDRFSRIRFFPSRQRPSSVLRRCSTSGGHTQTVAVPRPAETGEVA